MFFLVSNLPKLISFFWKKMEKGANSRKKFEQQKKLPNFETKEKIVTLNE